MLVGVGEEYEYEAEILLLSFDLEDESGLSWEVWLWEAERDGKPSRRARGDWGGAPDSLRTARGRAEPEVGVVFLGEVVFA